MNRREVFQGVGTFLLITPVTLVGGRDSRANDPVKGPLDPRVIGEAVKLVLTSDKKEYAQLEPIVISYTLKNASKDATLIFHSSFPASTFINLVVKSKKDVVPSTNYDRDLSRRYKGNTTFLRSGQELQGQMIANLIRDMSSAARYSVVASLRMACFVGDPKNQFDWNVTSEPISVEVKWSPRLSK